MHTSLCPCSFIASYRAEACLELNAIGLVCNVSIALFGLP